VGRLAFLLAIRVRPIILDSLWQRAASAANVPVIGGNLSSPEVIDLSGRAAPAPPSGSTAP
jgi:hypothetical protein